jgi:hypothetical protein
VNAESLSMSGECTRASSSMFEASGEQLQEQGEGLWREFGVCGEPGCWWWWVRVGVQVRCSLSPFETTQLWRQSTSPIPRSKGWGKAGKRVMQRNAVCGNPAVASIDQYAAPTSHVELPGHIPLRKSTIGLPTVF